MLHVRILQSRNSEDRETTSLPGSQGLVLSLKSAVVVSYSNHYLDIEDLKLNLRQLIPSAFRPCIICRNSIYMSIARSIVKGNDHDYIIPLFLRFILE